MLNIYSGEHDSLYLMPFDLSETRPLQVTWTPGNILNNFDQGLAFDARLLLFFQGK